MQVPSSGALPQSRPAGCGPAGKLRWPALGFEAVPSERIDAVISPWPFRAAAPDLVPLLFAVDDPWLWVTWWDEHPAACPLIRAPIVHPLEQALRARL